MRVSVNWEKGDSIMYIIYIWLCWVFVASLGFSVVAVSRDCSLVVMLGLLIAVSSLVAEPRLQARGFQ